MIKKLKKKKIMKLFQKKVIIYILKIIKKHTIGNILEKIQYFYEMMEFRGDKSIRIGFTNFPSAFDSSKKNNFFTSAFRETSFSKFILVKFYNPHIQFFCVSGNTKKLKNSKAKVKIFYTGESLYRAPFSRYRNCLDNVDLSLGFDFSDADNYLRFPLWLMYYFAPTNSKDDIKSKLNNFKQSYQKTKFCAMLARYDILGMRTKIYNKLSGIDRIDCPSVVLHNDNSLRKMYNDNKFLYLQQYKFNICPENSSSPGYVTEKLFQSLYSGCIPVYWGWSKDPEPGIINPDIIFYYDELDGPNNKQILNEVKKLHENDKLYRSFVSQPFFCDTAVDKIYTMLQQYIFKLRSVTDPVFESNISER